MVEEQKLRNKNTGSAGYAKIITIKQNQSGNINKRIGVEEDCGRFRIYREERTRWGRAGRGVMRRLAWFEVVREDANREGRVV